MNDNNSNKKEAISEESILEIGYFMNTCYFVLLTYLGGDMSEDLRKGRKKLRFFQRQTLKDSNFTFQILFMSAKSRIYLCFID